jgi:hypothetical protein
MCRARERYPRLLLLDELDTGEETASANVADVRQRAQRRELPLKYRPQCGAPLDELVLAQVAQRRSTCRAGHRVV